ncbi:NYN domain-containing protein [Pseudodesulfovibrio sp. JC047]|uniref:NYN domain-containing protein n=1 Tax=Pseudodesulfovibrio sp. JC047 TaxID=2683199 RepID=UPI0013D44107|nr:NYN domain-containing protein [Pseudodesulfovibrio sp. JC047]
MYWYDGPGNSGKAEEHETIEKLNDFKLRLGTRNRTGQQKAVDGLIIADLISLTQNRAISDALLVSGDADLTPGVVAAQNLGLRVHLLTMGPEQATSPFLAAEADYKQRWPSEFVQTFATMAQEETEVTPSSQPIVTEAPINEHFNAETLAQSFLYENGEIDRSKILAERFIPRSIDFKILQHARQVLGRRLIEDEKRSLRSAIKNHVQTVVE